MILGRTTLYLLLFSATVLASCGTSTKPKQVATAASLSAASDSATFRIYRSALSKLAAADWQDRKAIFNVFRQHGFRSLAADSANRWLLQQDAARLHTFQALEQRYGWPRASKVGKAGVQQAYLLVQHAPAAVQASYQYTLRTAHARGELPSPDYATYLDRVFLNQNHPQRYGTQTARRVLATGKEEDYLLPVEDITKLDERRASMQLEPILAHLQPGTLTLKPQN